MSPVNLHLIDPIMDMVLGNKAAPWQDQAQGTCCANDSITAAGDDDETTRHFQPQVYGGVVDDWETVVQHLGLDSGSGLCTSQR